MCQRRYLGHFPLLAIFLHVADNNDRPLPAEKIMPMQNIKMSLSLSCVLVPSTLFPRYHLHQPLIYPPNVFSRLLYQKRLNLSFFIKQLFHPLKFCIIYQCHIYNPFSILTKVMLYFYNNFIKQLRVLPRYYSPFSLTTSVMKAHDV